MLNLPPTFWIDPKVWLSGIEGSINVNLTVSKKLVVETSEASTVYYRCEPTIKKDLSGSSKVIKD